MDGSSRKRRKKKHTAENLDRYIRATIRVKWHLNPDEMDIYDFNDMMLVDMDKTKLLANFSGFTGTRAPMKTKKDAHDLIMESING